VILDAYTRAVRGWALSRSLEQQLTLEALDMALSRGIPFIFHSDQGSQYAAWQHTERLLSQGVHISMSDKASPTQNGLVERFMRTVKEEHVDYSEYRDFEDAYQQLKHWLEIVYMTERIHEALDYVTPAEFEAGALAGRYTLLNPA
jgi:transposase InsO family protein